MKTLLYWTWGFFAADALLGIVLIIAAIFDNGDAAGRGLAMVYAVFTVIVVGVLTIIVAVAAHFRTTTGLGIVLALEIAPWAFLLYEGARRIAAALR